MRLKILISGGSGFIGTNLLNKFMENGYEVLNIDIKEPKIDAHKRFWKCLDIRNYEEIRKTAIEFQPDYIVHLAARTDLDGKTLESYSANTVGVKNLLLVVQDLMCVKKIIVTSSKLVAKDGYKVKNQRDYCPHTLYGESKVITEEEVWKNMPVCDWCIIRPTSIWGPWFGIPYRNFFDMVLKHIYFHIGKSKCFKTYGYIGNSVYQIEKLLFSDTSDINNKVFYIGDMPAYEINEWADEIAESCGFKVYRMPKWVFLCLAKFGDLLKIFHIHFPMTSFRLSNMTNDAVIDLSNIKDIVPELPYTRKEGIALTLEWMKNKNS